MVKNKRVRQTLNVTWAEYVGLQPEKSSSSLVPNTKTAAACRVFKIETRNLVGIQFFPGLSVNVFGFSLPYLGAEPLAPTLGDSDKETNQLLLAFVAVVACHWCVGSCRM